MEDLLLQIVKEASSTKLSILRKSAQDAHGKFYVSGQNSNRIFFISHYNTVHK